MVETNTANAAKEKVEVFCDGSCLKNPGPGGWAALLRVHHGTEVLEKMVVGGAPDTTNNRMELQAAIGGLAALKRSCSVTVVTDSNYVVQGMTTWVHGWKKKAWRKADGKPVENREFWEQLCEAAAPHDVRWQWVRGHNGHAENERVDEAARAEAERVAHSLRRR